jgi:putative transposase
MTAPKSVDPAGVLREQLDSASADLLGAMVKTFAEALMSAEADAVCGAPYGVHSDERTNQRNGYRLRKWGTRAGTIELTPRGSAKSSAWTSPARRTGPAGWGSCAP